MIDGARHCTPTWSWNAPTLIEPADRPEIGACGLPGEERTIETSFLFLCLGGVPNTQWAKEVGIVRDEQGYLVTGPDLRKFSSLAEIWKLNREPYYLETSMPGVFAAGDVRHDSIKRVASAVGEGAMTIAFVHRYLASG